jgi:DNA-binding NtrC family response regulator
VSLRDAKEVVRDLETVQSNVDFIDPHIVVAAIRARDREVVEACKKVMFDYFSKDALYTDAIDAIDRIMEEKP